jgi:hypothetical protein
MDPTALGQVSKTTFRLQTQIKNFFRRGQCIKIFLQAAESKKPPGYEAYEYPLYLAPLGFQRECLT